MSCWRTFLNVGDAFDALVIAPATASIAVCRMFVLSESTCVVYVCVCASILDVSLSSGNSVELRRENNENTDRPSPCCSPFYTVFMRCMCMPKVSRCVNIGGELCLCSLRLGSISTLYRKMSLIDLGALLFKLDWQAGRLVGVCSSSPPKGVVIPHVFLFVCSVVSPYEPLAHLFFFAVYLFHLCDPLAWHTPTKKCSCKRKICADRRGLNNYPSQGVGRTITDLLLPEAFHSTERQNKRKKRDRATEPLPKVPKGKRK